MFLSRQHRTALALLTYSLYNRAMFCVVCGDIGTGKTTLLRYLLSRHEPHLSVGMITSTTGTFTELLQWMLSEFGLDYRGLDKIGMQQALVAYLKRLETLSRRALLVIDEAQALAPEVLEELRLFSNVNAGRTVLLQTVLVGQLALRDTLRRPDMRQLAQRVAVDYVLTPLDKEQTEAYIRHRLGLRLRLPAKRIFSLTRRAMRSTPRAAASRASSICSATPRWRTASRIRSRRSTAPRSWKCSRPDRRTARSGLPHRKVPDAHAPPANRRGRERMPQNGICKPFMAHSGAASVVRACRQFLQRESLPL